LPPEGEEERVELPALERREDPATRGFYTSTSAARKAFAAT